MVTPFFFIHNTRSKELKQRLLELNLLRQALEEYPRKPVVNKTRASKQYQPLVDDYNKLIEEVNEQRKINALSIEVIITLAYQVDRTSNPDLIDEALSIFSKELRMKSK